MWLRRLIKPEPGAALVYADWSSQEFGIAAALSGDPRMMEAYGSGDPYLARWLGRRPAGATKEPQASARDVQGVVLEVSYGMESEALASRLGVLPLEARELLRKFRETYPRFWRWAQNIVDAAFQARNSDRLRLASGHAGGPEPPFRFRNFPMQANGAEMLRLAACIGAERGIRIYAPVHDAILAEAPDDEIEEAAAALQQHMRAASRIVLAGFELRTDATLIVHPDRYDDPRGAVMWRRVMRRLNRMEGAAHG